MKSGSLPCPNCRTQSPTEAGAFNIVDGVLQQIQLEQIPSFALKEILRIGLEALSGELTEQEAAKKWKAVHPVIGPTISVIYRKSGPMLLLVLASIAAWTGWAVMAKSEQPSLESVVQNCPTSSELIGAVKRVAGPEKPLP